MGLEPQLGETETLKLLQPQLQNSENDAAANCAASFSRAGNFDRLTMKSIQNFNLRDSTSVPNYLSA
jgi:hypothetical protein